MMTVLRRLIVFVAIGIASALAVTSVTQGNAQAQQELQVQVIENPFSCDTIVRPLGTVSGLTPGEPVQFSAPELNGVFSERVADGAGRVEMRWNCDAPQTWSISIRGLVSGRTASFVLAGDAAPPPPDAPIGAAFDNKTALTAAEMAVWKDFSPFSTAGIYIPVTTAFDNRADKVQRNLTTTWVDQAFADGWGLIPIYVGLQAPDQCATGRFLGLSNDPTTARNQGLAAAVDAVNSVGQLGIGPGNPIYYDMEAYRPGCATAVLAFLDAWTEGVHAAGYLSGVYGSRSSTMTDLSRAVGRSGFDAPDAVWVSTGNGIASAYGLETPFDGLWANARMHQYRLNITRSYGGVAVEIDENIVDAPVARAIGTTPVTQASTDNDGDGIAEPEPDNCDTVANPDQADLDNDGDGDVCDADIDGDGVVNPADFAPEDPAISAAPAPTVAPTQVPTAVAIVDSDGDGVTEPEPDNCDSIANADQADLDNDGDGDACDSDIDGDGVANEADQDPIDPFVGAPPAPTAAPEPEPTEPATAPPATTPTVATPEAGDDQQADDQQAEQPPAEEPQGLAAPLAEPSPTVEPIPTPRPTPSPTPPPTPVESNPVESTAAESTDPGSGTGTPNDSIELATETVTISVAEESPWLTVAIAAIAAFTLFSATMGVRSFRQTRAGV